MSSSTLPKRRPKLAEHPTVRRFREREPAQPRSLDPAELRALCLELGADDVGFVDLDRPELASERPHALAAAPWTRTFVAFVCRMNREPIRSPARSVANLEFHHTGDHVNDVARRLVAALEARGVRALNPAMGFPMEMDVFPERAWVVSHKRVAEAAGLGRMGLNRNLIHPQFGNFILLGTVLIDAELSETGDVLDYDPCVDCRLCVSACPVGAIKTDGAFDFSACYTHNYREFMSGFTDWVETVADSSSARDYRRRVTDTESVSMWQSLSFGANYKAAYCMSVCPAGDDVIGPFLTDRKQFLTEVVKPLQKKVEPVYVSPDSDAEAHVRKRFPHKQVRQVSSGLRPRTIRGFLDALPLVFQRGLAEGLTARYQFTFTGEEEHDATVVIADQRVTVLEGHVGVPDLHITADARTWLEFLRGDRGIVWSLIRGRVRLRGPRSLLQAFARCFV